MTMPGILFAAGIDWLETRLPLLFVGFWIVSQVFAVFRRLAGGPRPMERVREIQRPRPPAPVAGPDPRDDLHRQIEEFLKQATSPTPAVVKRRDPPKPKPGAAKSGPPKREAQQPMAARTEGQRVGALGTAPSDVERHVHDAFAHELSHLALGLESPGRGQPGGESVAAARPAASTAQELVKAARNPATVRQAILLREILERPVDRW